MKELQKNMAESQKKIESIKPTIEGFSKMLKAGAKFTPDQVANAQKLIALNKSLTAQIQSNSEEYTHLPPRFCMAIRKHPIPAKRSINVNLYFSGGGNGTSPTSNKLY